MEIIKSIAKIEINVEKLLKRYEDQQKEIEKYYRYKCIIGIGNERWIEEMVKSKRVEVELVKGLEELILLNYDTKQAGEHLKKGEYRAAYERLTRLSEGRGAAFVPYRSSKCTKFYFSHPGGKRK